MNQEPQLFEEADVDIFSIPVYDDANLLPMLDSEEMEELVASIKEHGLRQPIVLAEIPNEDGGTELMLIDGRNRRQACQIAGVDPDCVFFEGTIDDIKAFILDTDTRRHNTKAQRTMRLAMIYPNADSKGGRGNKTVVFHNGLDKGALSQARFILRQDRALAERVLMGTEKFSVAYEKAKQKSEALVAEDRLRRVLQERLVAVRRKATDLADLVDEERMSLEEAEAALQARIEKRQRYAGSLIDSFSGFILRASSLFSSQEQVISLSDVIREFRSVLEIEQKMSLETSISVLESLRDEPFLSLLIAELKNVEKK